MSGFPNVVAGSRHLAYSSALGSDAHERHRRPTASVPTLEFMAQYPKKAQEEFWNKLAAFCKPSAVTRDCVQESRLLWS